jgi:hypothetical protein
VCDETADCKAGEVCCIKSIRPNGIETECRAGTTCGADPHLCRRNSECVSRNCVPWNCAGGVVETCNGLGADAGCTP